MHSDGTQGETAASQLSPGCPISDRSRISRRQAFGRISAVVGAGAVAWVVPEILTAKPAAGAEPSGPPASTGGSQTGDTGGTGTGGTATNGTATNGTATNGTGGTGTAAKAVTTAATTTSSPLGALASTGLNLERDAEIGAALIAGGWAMQHWASRTQKERPTS